jgi:thiamine biosynthesis protein ThiI
VPGQAFCYLGKEPGAGGLPIGTGGRVVALLSGGIDSPVAAWRLMRRGCDAVFVHFHSVPFLSRTSQDKARQLVDVLTRYQLRSRLYLVPFGELQRQLTMTVPGDLRVIVYRRMMLRIAERIGRRVHAKALVTGEVVGQVASQTLDNINVIGGAAYMPILRPLIALDKEEIIAQAQQLGTYAISIVPDEDCCTLFTPRHPETHARRYVVDEIESKLPIAEMIASAIAATEMEQLAYPVIK